LGDNFLPWNGVIERAEYLQKLVDLRDKRLIKVMTGIRRCGKSTLLEMFRNYLLEHGVMEQQIQSFNFEDISLEHLTDYRTLHKHIGEHLVSGKMNYIFLDEIQNVSEFQRAVDSLYIQKNIDLYVSGSNAYLLSGEIATLLSGRYVEIQMLPLSFREYISAFPDKFLPLTSYRPTRYST
jgi:predicted AAA+ superfamily ATPase